jgi:hypothetical protein
MKAPELSASSMSNSTLKWIASSSADLKEPNGPAVKAELLQRAFPASLQGRQTTPVVTANALLGLQNRATTLIQRDGKESP